MGINKALMVIFLTPFLLFGLLFVFWFGFDRWMSWKEKRKMGTNHIHHIILGFWSVLITYLGFHFYGKYSFLVGLIFATLTAMLYFFLSLRDIRYASIHEKIPNVPEYLLYGFAKPYLFFIMGVSCIVMLTGIDLLIVTWLNLSGDIRSYMGFFLWVSMCAALYFLLDKKIPSWEKQSKK
jgi:hypothetical protein